MSNVFAEYLLQQQELPIPGVGLLAWEAVPSAYDVAGRQFTPPGVLWHFTPVEQLDGTLPLQRFTGHVAIWHNLTEEEAFEEVQAFGRRIKTQLETTGIAAIGACGQLQAAEQELKFEPSATAVWLAPLPADRVMRKGASHQVLVGDQQTTTAEMEAYLAAADEEPVAVDRWWLWPVILAAIALALIVWRRVVEAGQ
jgi:hypothetical protein